MENIGQRIRKLRDAKGWTLDETAQKVGVHLSHIQKMEQEERGGSLPVLEKIADVFGVSLAYLLGIKSTRLETVGLRPIPLVSRIPAGDPIEYTDGDYPAGWAEEFVPCPEDIKDPAAFALKIEGHSMVPRFQDGDVVIVSPHTRLKDDIAVAFRLKNGDCGVKTFRLGANNEVILAPENSESGQVQVFKTRDFCWIYPVVKSQKDEY